MIERRTFLQASLAAGALAASGASCASSSSKGGPGPAKPAPKKILILGGTAFLGPELVAAARGRGHTLTLFNRGKTNPGLFPDLETLHGDRDGHLEALAGRKWDAVIDTSGYLPRIVRASAQLLAPSVEQYVFISTISVYEEQKAAGMDESAPVRTLPPGEEQSEERQKYYGALKALCEKEVAAALPGRATSIRPGLIVGPGDPTDRFTYWPVRIDRGGEAVAPGDGGDAVQYIDGRDLAAWVIETVEKRLTGTFNALGPERRLTMKELVDGCIAAAPAPPRPGWIPADFLDKHGVSAWQDMPVWIPSTPGEAVYGAMSNRAAVAAGLTFRPVAETARDTLAWWKRLPAERREKPMKAGLTPEREQEVLAAWKASAAR